MKKITQFVLCCPSCGCDDEIKELAESYFWCSSCDYDFDFYEAHHIEKELIEEDKDESL